MPIELVPDYDDFKWGVQADQEVDSQGVYEVWWSANSRYPDRPLSTRLAVTAQAAGVDMAAPNLSTDKLSGSHDLPLH